MDRDPVFRFKQRRRVLFFLDAIEVFHGFCR